MLVSTNNNLSKYASYIQLMLTTPESFKKLRGLTIGYEYKTDTDSANILRKATNYDLHLVGKINHEIYNIPQRMPPNVKIYIKLPLFRPILFCIGYLPCI